MMTAHNHGIYGISIADWANLMFASYFLLQLVDFVLEFCHIFSNSCNLSGLPFNFLGEGIFFLLKRMQSLHQLVVSRL